MDIKNYMKNSLMSSLLPFLFFLKEFKNPREVVKYPKNGIYPIFWENTEGM